MKATEDNVTYGELMRESSSSCYQDILINKKVEGCLHSRKSGCIVGIKETYQKCVKDTPANREAGKNWMETEDEGYIFVIFTNLTDFLTYFNKEQS